MCPRPSVNQQPEIPPAGTRSNTLPTRTDNRDFSISHTVHPTNLLNDWGWAGDGDLEEGVLESVVAASAGRRVGCRFGFCPWVLRRHHLTNQPPRVCPHQRSTGTPAVVQAATLPRSLMTGAMSHTGTDGQHRTESLQQRLLRAHELLRRRGTSRGSAKEGPWPGVQGPMLLIQILHIAASARR